MKAVTYIAGFALGLCAAWWASTWLPHRPQKKRTVTEEILWV